MQVKIEAIKIGNRYRKDPGDIELLAASIEQVGLLQPIGITENNELVFGHRRLLAFKHLGRDTIPARVIDVPAIVLAEHAENEIRKDFTKSERVAIGLAIEQDLAGRKGSNQYRTKEHVENSPHAEPGQKSREIAAKKAGFGSEFTYRQAKTVVTQGTPELVDAMDKGEIAVSTAAKLATAPEPVQRQAVADPKKAVELTRAASARKEKDAVILSKEIREKKTEQRRQERIREIASISNHNKELKTDIRYPVIYADPPWRYEHAESDSRTIENQYPTMELEEICGLPIEDITTQDAILFLWATSPKLREAFQVIESWGFTYRTCAVWDKQRIGMGYYFRQRHELLLVATKGSIPAPVPESRPESVIVESRGQHSEKPARFAEIIEKMYPDLPKIELFCRAQRAGWAVWGNQSDAA